MRSPDDGEIRNAFSRLYEDEYVDDVAETVQEDGEASLRVDWHDLAAVDGEIAEYTLWKPGRAQAQAERALTNTIEKPFGDLHIRFNNIRDSRSLRVSDLRASHLGELVSIEGKVVEAEKVQPLITEAAFECVKCGTMTYMEQGYGDIIEPATCRGCEDSKSYVISQSASTIIDYRCVIIKSMNTNIEDPPVIAVYLLHDLVDVLGEGDEVNVVGSYEIHPLSRQSETELNTYVEAVDIDVEVYAEVDSVSAEQLTAYIYDAVNELMETNTSFGASSEEVVEYINDEHGVRKTEAENRIDELVEADDEDLMNTAGRLTK